MFGIHQGPARFVTPADSFMPSSYVSCFMLIVGIYILNNTFILAQIKKRQRDSGRKKGKNAGGSGAAGGDESSEDSEHSSGRAGSEGDQKQNMRE